MQRTPLMTLYKALRKTKNDYDNNGEEQVILE